MKRYLYFLFVSLSIILFLSNSKITMSGSAAGLILWFQTVVPTLFPFMILSSVLINLNGERILHKILSPVTSKILGLSPSGNYILFIGLFCGYPLGAKTAADLLKENRITLREAQYLMNFCNNISPIFTIGFICNTLLNDKKIIPMALLVLYGVPIISGIITKKYYIGRKAETINTASLQNTPQNTNLVELLDNAIINAAQTSLKLGGYIIIFSVFCSLAEHSHVLPEIIKLFASVLLEVTNGCKSCVSSPFIIKKNIMLPSLFACATFGGIAGIFQTSGMIKGTDLSLKHYVIFRVICSISVFIISYIALSIL